MMMETWGAKFHFSPFDLTNVGAILSKYLNSPHSLGIAVSKAVDMHQAGTSVSVNADTKYSLGNVLNHVLMHHTIISEECIKQMAIWGET
eukprot:Gb_23234 [translate_table: standard]